MRQGQIGSRKNKGFQGWVRRNHNPTISVKKSVGYAALTYPAILPSRPRRHLIEEPGDAADPAVAEHGEIRAFDRAVGAVGTEAPGEADVIAKAGREAGMLTLKQDGIRKILKGLTDLKEVMSITLEENL